MEIAPSILSADFSNLESEIAQMVSEDIRIVHLDVMDGHFVPNITFGPPAVKWIRQCTDAVLDTHLMITDPEKYAPAFIEAGADHITFHIETVDNPVDFVKWLHDQGVTAGITLNPKTPVGTIEKVSPHCEMVLVMTVQPGFGGQEVRIEVDGGIGPETIATARDYGADTFVAGNAIFGKTNRAGAIAELRQALMA
ncbi:MAG: ribulose-phosphate 3-epimerase [Planctomycetota bacterium]